MELKIKETDLVNQCLDYLSYKKIFAFRANTMGNYNPKTNSYYKNPRLMRGVADILCCINGKFIGIECKTGKNTMSEHQELFKDNLLKAGGEYWLIYSLEELEAKIKN